jgi:hypothetical protein
MSMSVGREARWALSLFNFTDALGDLDESILMRESLRCASVQFASFAGKRNSKYHHLIDRFGDSISCRDNTRFG